MDLSPTAYRFTVKDYHRMAEGVPEVWVVDVNAGVVHVAAPGARRTVARGESLAFRISCWTFPPSSVDARYAPESR